MLREGRSPDRLSLQIEGNGKDFEAQEVMRVTRTAAHMCICMFNCGQRALVVTCRDGNVLLTGRIHVGKLKPTLDLSIESV